MRKLVILAFVGLAAQLVDGSLGMGYGVTSATLLVAGGLGPAAASAAIHFSEIATTLASGASHAALGNVDWGTVGILALPGFVGAFAGATLLVSVDASIAVPAVAVILLALGGYVTWRFLTLRHLRFEGRPSARFLAPVGLVAGALDSVGGGGWGPVGTTTMLSSGRLEPRKVVGSVDAAEFVVTLGASLGFLLALGREGIEWSAAAALLVGGVVAAPLAAVLVRFMPPRVLGVAAGGVIVLTNLRTLAVETGVSDLNLGLIAAVVFTLWVLWVSYAVKLEQAERAGSDDPRRQVRAHLPA
ncbi:sulfite exporter TauE/SafE family protein [Nocardioides mangrovi]|uniref:Probable membrane transporter protein n=1 Tax=Nocardioides mangrovi TaxID=2874580 RepID=A0ABS7UA62_9ACTN|nr:sulfite exporter TauE/SafE family protein [Nocardioides mangrovi]MBZ5737883.1 sulfite exporter TauE/SafE family protein [Nocardioides mangrovi]